MRTENHLSLAPIPSRRGLDISLSGTTFAELDQSILALAKLFAVGLLILLTCVMGSFLYLLCFRRRLRATMTGTELFVTR